MKESRDEGRKERREEGRRRKKPLKVSCNLL